MRFAHDRHDGAIAVEEPVHIDVEHLSPCLDRIFPCRRVRSGDARRAYEHIDTAQSLGGRLRGTLDRVMIGHVERMRHDGDIELRARIRQRTLVTIP
jgi:hypothetical protein